MPITEVPERHHRINARFLFIKKSLLLLFVDSMLNKDYTAKLLNLEDVIITNVENISGEVHVYLELPRAKHRCPACGTLTDRVHDYRMQTIKDVPLGRTTLLHLRKRRYRCDCGKRFFENNTFLPRYHRATGRLVAEIINAFRETVFVHAPKERIHRHFRSILQ